VSAVPTTYAQQLFASYQLDGRHPSDNLRKHHSDDLLAKVKSYQAKGQAVILLGDLNEVPGDTNDGMTRLITSFSTPYSPEIVRLRNIEWLVIKSYKSKFNLTIQVDEVKRKLGSLVFDLPDNLKDCQRL
jgi:hypothetical protein